MKILVVEEIAGQQSAVCEILERQQHCVEQVCGGREAISRATRQSYDLIVLDLMLSSDTSLLVLHEIRELNRNCDILILSNPEQIRDRVTALIQGADDYLVKPFKPEDLYARILSLAKRRNGLAPTSRRANKGQSKTDHLNRLIENLSHQGAGDFPGIELVFSEVKLTPLLARLRSYLYESASLKGVVLRLPEPCLPTIFVDARWTEYLLVNLLGHVISQSPFNNLIALSFLANNELGELTIQSSFPIATDGDNLPNGVTGPYRAPAPSACETTDPLSLAKFCAQRLNLPIHVDIEDRDRLQIRISNIRII